MAPDSEEAPEGFSEAETRLFCNPTLNVTIHAAPMELGEYLELRGWKAAPEQDTSKPGYLVERPDMGPPNQDGFDSFIAWLPKRNFEEYYEKLGRPNA